MKRITVKVGSSFFIDSNGNVNVSQIKKLVAEICELKKLGFDVCLVSSGAIAVGIKKMKLKRKPSATNRFLTSSTLSVPKFFFRTTISATVRVLITLKLP